MQRACRRGSLTFLCLFLTVVVLRGTIGAGKFGTPEQDLNEIRQQFYSRGRRVEPHRVLEEVQSTETNN
ncbi:xyloglucan 6-xylosyltransferase 2-like, partial [Trifolium medium]|nr:xyloglucan 6-xylosyltransferase 2-like [Trifolium medium]